MGIVIRILKIIAVLVVLLVAIAYLLPRQVSVQRSVEIAASAEDIFPHLNSLQAMAAWSPWLGQDPNVQLTYTGPETGVGGVLVWSSDNPNVGMGRQEITASVANERVETALDFGPQGTATAALVLMPGDTGTIVTWSFDTDMGPTPMGRWLGLMMDRWVGADYEDGLARLKALVEGG